MSRMLALAGVLVALALASGLAAAQQPATAQQASFNYDDATTKALLGGKQEQPGAALFLGNCVSCHGADGKGNRELGAPNLTDKIWLYGSSEADLIDTITNSRGGVMPAWAGRLDPATINALTVYVHTLGGGE